MITGIRNITVFVSDQQRSQRFFTETLGFELCADNDFAQGRWIEVAPRGAGPVLVLADWFQPSGDRFSRIVFEAADVEVTCAGFQARGVTFVELPTRHPWGVQAQFLDPDGNLFIIVGR